MAVKHYRWALAFALAATVWAAGTGAGVLVAERAGEWTLEHADGALDAAALEEVEPDRDSESDRNSDRESDRNSDRGAAPAQPSKGAVFLFILGRNTAVYLWLLTGLLSAGAVTFVVLLYNGIQLGLTIGFAQQAGMPAGVMTDLLLTHGVLELGAFFVAGAVGFQGLRLATGWSRMGRASFSALRLGTVLLFGLCALTGAAAIETFVTPQLVRFHAPAG